MNARTYQVCLLVATLLIAGEAWGETPFYIGDSTQSHTGSSVFIDESAVLWRDTMTYQYQAHTGDTVRKFYVKSSSSGAARNIQVALYYVNTAADTPTVRVFMDTITQVDASFGWDSSGTVAVPLVQDSTYVMAVLCYDCESGQTISYGTHTVAGTAGARYKSGVDSLRYNFQWSGGNNTTSTYMFYARGDSSGTAPASSVLKVGPVKLGTTKLGP